VREQRRINMVTYSGKSLFPRSLDSFNHQLISAVVSINLVRTMAPGLLISG